MRSVILLVLMVCLSVLSAENSTTDSVVVSETEAVSINEQLSTTSTITTPTTITSAATTTVPRTVASTTIAPTTAAPTTAAPPTAAPATAAPPTAAPTAAPTSAVPITAASTAPVATIAVPNVTRPTKVKQTTVFRRVTTSAPITTTRAPVNPRSRSRVAKAERNVESTSKPQLLPIKVLKTEKSDIGTISNTVFKAEPRQIRVKVIPSDPIESPRRNEVSVGVEAEKSSETKSSRRGKVRYLTGKELGRDAPAVKFESKYESDQFKFSYETEDGQTRAENGIFENMGTEDQVYTVKGSYSYFDEEGIEYLVEYTADTKGYRPVITVKNPHRA